MPGSIVYFFYSQTEKQTLVWKADRHRRYSGTRRVFFQLSILHWRFAIVAKGMIHLGPFINGANFLCDLIYVKREGRLHVRIRCETTKVEQKQIERFNK
jgi:hypothetical protein